MSDIHSVKKKRAKSEEKAPKTPEFTFVLRVEDVDADKGNEGNPHPKLRESLSAGHRGNTHRPLKESLSASDQSKGYFHPVLKGSKSASGSPSDSKDRDGGKNKKSAFFHHFLHPLDYYHERKSRSSTSSINSDFGDSEGDSTPRSRTPETPKKSKFKFLSRPINPNAFLSDSFYKPPLRKRASSPDPRSSSPSHSLRSSPFGSPNQSQQLEFYNNAMQNPDSRYPDGHEANKRATYMLRKPERGNHKNVQQTLKPPESALGVRLKRRDKERNRFSTGSSNKSSSSSSSSSRSGSSSYSGSESSSSSPEERKKKTRQRKHHKTQIGGSTRIPKLAVNPPSDNDIQNFQIRMVGSDYKPPSPGSSPGNPFLLSVMTDHPNHITERKVGQKSSSYNVPRRRREYDDDDDDDDEVFTMDFTHDKNHTQHIGMVSEKSKAKMNRTSSVERLYSVYEQIIREGNKLFSVIFLYEYE